jgi:hypothetical protein
MQTIVNFRAGCDFTAILKNVVMHEEDCLYRSTLCAMLSCQVKVKFNEVEEHMARSHGEMGFGTWVTCHTNRHQIPLPIIHQSDGKCFTQLFKVVFAMCFVSETNVTFQVRYFTPCEAGASLARGTLQHYSLLGMDFGTCG